MLSVEPNLPKWVSHRCGFPFSEHCRRARVLFGKVWKWTHDWDDAGKFGEDEVS